MKKSWVLVLICSLGAFAAQAATIEMKVFGMVCGFCAQGIEKSLRKNSAAVDVAVSLENKLVAVQTRDGHDIPDAELKKAITDAGYDVKSINRTQRSMTEIRAEIAQAPK